MSFFLSYLKYSVWLRSEVQPVVTQVTKLNLTDSQRLVVTGERTTASQRCDCQEKFLKAKSCLARVALNSGSNI